MVLAQVAIYIFLLVITLYLSYRVLWLVFFLFNFRFWQTIAEKFASEFMSSLTSGEQFLLLALLSILSYSALLFLTLRMPIIRYIMLAILFVAAIRIYSITDILFFRDYFVEGEMWSIHFWINQLKAIFSFDTEQIINMFMGVIKIFAGFFEKIVGAIKGL